MRTSSRGFRRPSVSNSGSDISAPPSPSAATVSRSGRASAAPIALPSPSPTHWKACGKTKPAASGTRRYIDGQPWKWPESTTTVRSSGSIASSASVSVRGSSRPGAAASSYGSCCQAPAAISSASAAVRRDERVDRQLSPRSALGGRARVADHADVDGPVGADRVGVEVDLGHARAVRDQRPVARRPLVQRGAEGDHRVRLAQQPRGDRRREPARDPERVRVAGEQAVGDRRGGEHGAGQLAQPPQRGAGAGQHRAAAGDDRGPLGVRQQRHERVDRPRPRRRQLGQRRRQRRIALGRLHVERQHQHHRAPLDAGAAHGARHVGHRGVRPVHALGDRPDRLHQPGLVDAEVRPQRGGGRVGGEHDQRRAALGRLGQPRHGVRHARALVHAAGGEPPAHARVPVGHADRPALVARGNERHAGVAQRVGGGQVAAPEQPEDGVDAERRERPADRLGDQHGASGRSAGRAGRRRRRGSPRGSGSTSRSTPKIASRVPTTKTSPSAPPASTRL